MCSSDLPCPTRASDGLDQARHSLLPGNVKNNHPSLIEPIAGAGWARRIGVAHGSDELAQMARHAPRYAGASCVRQGGQAQAHRVPEKMSFTHAELEWIAGSTGHVMSTSIRSHAAEENVRPAAATATLDTIVARTEERACRQEPR